MNRRFTLRMFALVVLFGVLLVPAQRASATTSFIYSGHDGIEKDV